MARPRPVRGGAASAGAAGLLSLLVLTLPLPFGGVTPWAVALAQGLLFLCLAVAIVGWRAETLVQRPSVRRLPRMVPAAALAPALALAAVGALGLLQALPLPLASVSLLSPAHAELAARAREATTAAAEGGPSLVGGTASLSVAPGVSSRIGLWWLALAAAFVASVFVGRSRDHRRWLAVAVVGAATFQAIYATQAWWLGVDTIWGWVVPAQPGRLRGTFVNPAHLGALLEVALAVTFAGGWFALRRALDEPALERRALWVAPPLTAWFLLFAVLTFTGSRAALLGATAGVVVQGLLISAGWRGEKPVQRGRRSGSRLLTGALSSLINRWGIRLLPAVMLVVLGVGLAAWLAFDRGLVRFTRFSPLQISVTARLAAYESSWELWQRFPVTGTGLGTFREAFPLVQPETLPGEWWHAHSDPLELLVTTGLLGVVLMAVGAFFLLRRLLRVLRRAERSEDRAAAVAALGALAALVVHEGVDFPLTMPAVALALTVVCGAACGVFTPEAAAAPPVE